jgi:hypothetical protein
MIEQRKALLAALASVTVRVPVHGNVILGEVKAVVDVAQTDAERAHNYVHHNANNYFPYILAELQKTEVKLVPFSTNEAATLSPQTADAAVIFATFVKWATKGLRPGTKRNRAGEIQPLVDATVTPFAVSADHIDTVCVQWLRNLQSKKFTFTIPTGEFSYSLRDLHEEGVNEFVHSDDKELSATSPVHQIAAYAYCNHARLAAQLVDSLEVPACAWRSILHKLHGCTALHANALLTEAEHDKDKLCAAIVKIVTANYSVVTGGTGLTLAAVIAETTHLLGATTVTTACVRQIGEQLRQCPGHTGRSTYRRKEPEPTIPEETAITRDIRAELRRMATEKTLDPTTLLLRLSEMSKLHELGSDS